MFFAEICCKFLAFFKKKMLKMTISTSVWVLREIYNSGLRLTLCYYYRNINRSLAKQDDAIRTEINLVLPDTIKDQINEWLLRGYPKLFVAKSWPQNLVFNFHFHFWTNILCCQLFLQTVFKRPTNLSLLGVLSLMFDLRVWQSSNKQYTISRSVLNNN